MKNKHWFLFILGCLLLLSVWTYQSRKTYFIPVQVVGNTYGRLPYVKVEIEGREYFFILDLGFSGQAKIASACLSEIPNKVFEKNSTSIGFSGSKYQKNVYRVPELKVDQMKFHSVLVEEDNIAFHVDSAISPSLGFIPEITSGALGCMLFQKACVCLDLHFSMIAFCDSFDTFKRELHPNNPFSKVPFFFSNGFIEFEMSTPNGPLHCLLDTGSTLNHINTPNLEDIPIKEFVKAEVYFDNVQIGGKDFGPITFSPLPIKLPVNIEAIIGLEFLLQHVVFIDFLNHEIYFEKSTYTAPTSY